MGYSIGIMPIIVLTCNLDIHIQRQVLDRLIGFTGLGILKLISSGCRDTVCYFSQQGQKPKAASAAVFIGVCEKAVTAVKNSTHEIIVFFMVIQIIIKKLLRYKVSISSTEVGRGLPPVQTSLKASTAN